MTKAVVLFIGTNPSTRSPTPAAFHDDTRSGATLHDWIAQADIKTYLLRNVSEFSTPKNRPLTNDEIGTTLLYLRHSCDDPRVTHIVALGKTASKALSKIGVKFLEMPHPSGLNRKLNDPAYVEEQIQRLRDYVSKP